MTSTYTVEKPVNILSVDFEDWPQSTLDRSLPISSCVVSNIHRLLEIFSEYKAKATFCVMALIAETYSDLVQDIAAGGHLHS